MKHFSLKFKLSRCVILKYLVLKFAIFGIIIAEFNLQMQQNSD